MTPERQARVNIDDLLEQAGWAVQDSDSVNLYAANGVAVREFPLKSGHGKADYLLYVNRKAVGVVEAKPEGSTLTGVEVQSEKYSTGLPDNLPAHRPLYRSCTRAPAQRRSSPTGWTRSREAVRSSPFTPPGRSPPGPASPKRRVLARSSLAKWGMTIPRTICAVA